jgi:hypothetical protein
MKLYIRYWIRPKTPGTQVRLKESLCTQLIAWPLPHEDNAEFTSSAVQINSKCYKALPNVPF